MRGDRPIGQVRGVLPTDELKRRVEAARILRGLTQNQLADLVHADGLGRHDVGRLERGDIPLTRVLRDALCRHLGVTEEWFTEPDVDVLLRGIGEDDVNERLDRIERAVTENRGSLLDLIVQGSRSENQVLKDALDQAADAQGSEAGSGTRGAADASPAGAQAPSAERQAAGRRHAP